MAVAVSAGSERVLVVDDDEPLARVMARTLRSRGFECDVALDGSQARRLVEPMRRAAELQAGMLPPSPLTAEGFEIAAHFTPAREISGDFYDWYGASPGHITLTLGDVMGKGLLASLTMATARAALRGVAGVEPVVECIKQAAGVMSAALEVNHSYVTVFYGRFDPRTGHLDYVDAGHGHARLLRGSTSQELLPQRSAPIGMFPDTQFISGTVTLNPGDSLVVFSDGLLDLRPDLATKEVQLPYEARRAATAQEMVDMLARGARDRELSDDVTVLALRRV